MSISKKQTIQAQRVGFPKMKDYYTKKPKKTGNKYFNIIVRDSVHQEKCGNKVLNNISESECIEHIRTIFADYTGFCPPYSMIKDGLTTHCKECPCATHWFFETEAVCMSSIDSVRGSSNLIAHILDVYNFIEHLSRKKKQDIIQEKSFQLPSTRYENSASQFIFTPF